MAQSVLKGCEICERGPGNNFCLDCEQFLCDDCRKCHARLKVSKNHKFNSDPSDPPEVKSRCKDHNDDHIYLCVQCNKPVCKRCIIGQHKGHELSIIEDVIAELKESVNKATATRSKQTDGVIRKLDEGLKSLESAEHDAINKMNFEGTKLKEMIDREVEKKVSLLKRQVKIEREKLNRLLSEARELKETENALLSQLNDLKQSSEDVTLLEKLRFHKDEIEKLKMLTVERFPTVTYASKAIPENNIANLLGKHTIQELVEKEDIYPDSQPQKPDNPEKEIQHGFLYRCRTCGSEELCNKSRMLQ